MVSFSQEIAAMSVLRSDDMNKEAVPIPNIGVAYILNRHFHDLRQLNTDLLLIPAVALGPSECIPRLKVTNRGSRDGRLLRK